MKTGTGAATLYPLLATLACGLLASCTGGEGRAEEFSFKIAVIGDGRVRVAFDELGFHGSPPRSSQLLLTERGQEVALHVDDGGDDRFGPGDSLTFLGRHLQGEHSWFDPWSDENIYLLRLRDDERAPAPKPDAVTLPSSGDTAASTLTRHFEREDIRVALPGSTEEHREAWFWKRLSHLDREPFGLPLADGMSPVGIRVALVGLSADAAAAAAALPQHRVELLVNGQVIASEDWNGQTAVEISAGETALANALAQSVAQAPDKSLAEPLDRKSEPTSRIELRVPQRYVPGQPVPVIDVVLLNWIEIDIRGADAPGSLSFPVHGPGTERHYAADTALHTPRWIKAFRERGLRSATGQADYLMIAHGSLLEALAPLADFHRQRGLNVEVVDVEDIYNEFNDGIVSPFAIRDFIRHVGEHRAAPGPRYVLLVGDASWDVRGEGKHRNLIPTLQVQAHDELAASDNGFVAFRGEDGRPDLAIGRIPAADPAELSAVVEKLLDYARGEPAGAGGEPAGTWQQQVALVSDASADFQVISNELAADLARRGLAVTTVYPDAAMDTARQDQQDLVHALDAGQVLVHFLGHGGRFVWRTGPLDYKDSSDLFSVADVEQLENRDRLPLVLSMTCSSGPFDHPEAGSIAEAFLMLPDRGAMGVLAASWRVPASQSFSTLLLEEVMQPGQSIGEAILKAKQKEPSQELVESYNFFGDPALELRLDAQGAEPNTRGRKAGGKEDRGQAPHREPAAVETEGPKPHAANFGATIIRARNPRATNFPTTNSPSVKPNVINWGTASEHGSFGYEVFRGLAEEGPFAAVNTEVIPGGGTTDVPRRYEFVDDSIEPDTIYWYYIESISLTGERKRITPIYPSKPKPAKRESE